ncbi:hypothetical protein FLONG3_10579 [Fusarium longipes]|uniref:Major facilitator superfamily (MFS) profile domain-containing protein n=1 Tax=Fusarium longipes TaxID=694270 RepID=A0A395RMN2_9HYPO|nr:hypothetical protein FLONG3_10579 [Fusarium longipes]
MSDRHRTSAAGRSVDEESPLLAREPTKPPSFRQSAEPDPSIANEEPSNKHLFIVFGSVFTGVFLAALDTTVVATLSVPISNHFGSASLLSWLGSSYRVANAMCQPLSGRLTDIFSRRSGLIVCNVLFAVGTLMCGLATSKWVLLTGRAVAGMGGGGLNAITAFLVSDLVPLRKRGVIQGFVHICYGVGAGLGGLFGGWMNDLWGWRAAFLYRVPVIAISAVLVCLTVKGSSNKADGSSRLSRVDFLGAFTLCLALVLLLLGLNAGGNLVEWTHPLVLASMSLSAVAAGMFVFVETTWAKEFMIPMHLLLNQSVFAACLMNWFICMVLFMATFYVPVFFQVNGLSTTASGIRLLPQSVGTAIGSLTSGYIMKRTGQYWSLGLIVVSASAFGFAGLSTMTINTPTFLTLLYVFLVGVGYGGMLSVALLATVAAVSHEEQAVATSANYAFRSTGSTIGVTIASTISHSLLQKGLHQRFDSYKESEEEINRILNSLDELKHLPQGWDKGVYEAYAIALRAVFLTGLGIKPGEKHNLDDGKLHGLQWSLKSPKSIEFIKGQLQNCSSRHTGHKSCPSHEQTKLPTRMILLDPVTDTIHLHETDESDRGVYAALSHCWGPPGLHPIRITGNTISQFKEPTPISDLTAVFQDAIWLCKQLGIYNIWIDSLCIIQDDGRDWQSESSKMAQYYSNAHVTIAVERSWDSNTHFLRDAEDRWRPMSYSTIDENGSSITYIIQEHYSHQAFLAGLSNYFKRGKDILLNRGWCLQEAVLSTRVIHFTPSDIIWECRSTMECLDRHHRPDQEDWNIRKILTKLEHWPSTDQDRQVATCKVWNRLVRKYTLRTLSFQQDKLPAFGGIASYFSRFYGDRYLAGIWESQLLSGLCWKVVETGQTQVRSLALEEPTAPSWSWASLPVGVGVDGSEDLGYECLAAGYEPRILETECQLSSTDAPFGRVNHGYILFEAPIFEVRLNCVSLSPNHPDWIQHNISWGDDVKIRERSTVTFWHDTLLAVHGDKVMRATTGRQLRYLEGVSSFHGTAWVLWLAGLNNGCAKGLVLGQTGNIGAFQRLGLVKITNFEIDSLPNCPSRTLIRLV